MNGGADHSSQHGWTHAREVSGPEEAAQQLVRDLTEPQRQAVLHTEGPLLVLAAAGSGKTRVITRRIAHLIGCGVPSWQILALTFTNKAAGEMRERVQRLLGAQYGTESRVVRGLTITTFHSLCARLLRRYATAAGLKEDFTIYDSDDQGSLCKKVIESLQLSTSNFPVRSVLSQISAAKNQLLDADQYAARAADFTSRNIAKVYKGYTRALRDANAVDFDDLLLLTARTLERDEGVRRECQQRWRYLLVDEYQDTNHAQFLIASLIAGAGDPGGGGPNFCVVGDPDQSIYGWRGADIGNILEFEDHYPGARVITLGENFRSTAPILKVADTLIRHNKRRRHKDLFTSRTGGDLPEAVLCRSERHESGLVVDWLRRRHETGVAWRDMAIFYRTNSLSRVMEEACREAGVPYTIARGTAYYDREEVKSALGYLRIVANSYDTVSLLRVVNVPARGIGDTTMEKVEEYAGGRGLSVFETLRIAAQIPGLTARAVGGITKFIEMVDGWTGGGTFLGAQVGGSLAELVDRVVRESGLRDMYVRQANTSKLEGDLERVDNLDELVSSARQFELEYDAAADAANEVTSEGARTPPLLALLRAYLESVALVADADAVDPAQGSVTLMTFHAAKGLEFDSVAMIGLEEGLLPHGRAISAVSGTDNEMEEERRLCFVGVTRSMKRLLMTSAKYRTVRGMEERTIPSRFLGEMPIDGMRVSDQSDVGSVDSGESESWDSGDEGESRRSQSRPGMLREHKPTSRPNVPDPFPVGSVVRHPQFGVGTVESLTGGTNARATIRFRDVGTKTLVLEYARLTRIG